MAFLYNFNFPFTNNRAEQDIRMIKVKQKISGSFRTFRGAESFLAIRCYISTARKNSLLIFPAIVDALNGIPFIPWVLKLTGVVTIIIEKCREAGVKEADLRLGSQGRAVSQLRREPLCANVNETLSNP